MSKKQVSKRQVLRESRRQKERQKRLIAIVAIVAVALILVGIVIAPTIREATTPVGDFAQITPVALPDPDGTALGNPDAPVLIEVFEDFKCTACRGYSTEIEKSVIDNLVKPGQVYYVFYQYPFLDDRSAIKESDKAANAAMCAAEQNRFWDYKTMLFENMKSAVGEFSDKRLLAFAEALGLDVNQFEECYNENRYQDEITKFIATGDEYGVSGTPSIFVDGVPVTPGFVPTYEQILAAVDAALGASGN